jgi:2'-5' RNA ligase
MRAPDLYRYFLAFRPDPVLRYWIASLQQAAGQHQRRIVEPHLHLTLCVLAETLERNHFIAPRVDSVLAGASLSSFLFHFGSVRGGDGGAALYTTGPKAAYRAFCRALFAQLAARDIVPALEKPQPHVTLGHDRCAFEPFRFPCEWTPGEILLIESEHGNGIHNVLGSWPLQPPPQGSFPFGLALPPIPPMHAAGGAR